MEVGTISNEFLYNKTSTAVSLATVSFSANYSSNNNAREESIHIINKKHFEKKSLKKVLKMFFFSKCFLLKHVFKPHSLQCTYRSGTVNLKSFVCKVLLQIKWKFELTYAL